MSRFKRTKIKSTKKSFVSIDEKIALLNKELKKTGLSEMTTDDVYQTAKEVPNPFHDTFKAASFGGKGFAMSGFGGAAIGGATFDANGLAFGPDGSGPATTYLGLASGFGPSAPGDQRTPEHRKTGAFLWYWNGSGYSTLEWKFNNQNVDNSGGWASWVDTAFGFPTLTFIGQIPGFDPDLADAAREAGGGGDTFPDPDDIVPPKNPLFTKDDLGDPSFLPLDIAKDLVGDALDTAKEAFDWLKKKAKDTIEGGTAISDAAKVFIDSLKHMRNPNSPWTFDNPKPVNLDNDQIERIVDDMEEIFDEWGDKRVDEINDGSPMTNKEMKQLNDKLNRNNPDKNMGSDLDAEYASWRLTVNNLGNPLGLKGNIKTNKDGTKTPIAIEDNYDFEGDADASAPGAPSIIKFIIDNPKVQKEIEKSPLKSEYRKDNEIDYTAVAKGGETPTILDKNMPIKVNLQPKKKSKLSRLGPLPESVGLGYFDPEELNVDIEDIRKGVMPEYPKKAPPKMIDGYSAASRLAPRVVKGEPTIKITRKDLNKFHKLKKSEISEFMYDIKLINEYLQKNPADLIYLQQRYPKNDPRLAALNWKMDQMVDASNEYMDSNFKVNQTLFKRATERTKRNTALTNPDYIQKHYDELRGTIKPKSKPTINRKSPSRFFKKPKKKSSMEEINDKIKRLDKDLLI